MNTVRPKYWLGLHGLRLLLATTYGCGLVVATGVIPAWGRWFSPSPHHRAQVEALLQGKLALSENPAALRFDLAWAQGGVHQVWGLGVPMWKLPFAAVGRIAGTESFPDHLAFVVALGITAWLVLRALSLMLTSDPTTSAAPKSPRGLRVGISHHRWELAGSATLLLLFAPFINLLHSRFDIYEEVVAYEYLWGLVLIAGLLSLAAQAKTRRFWTVCLLAGLGGLLRPTLILHGVGALVAAVLTMAWSRGEIPDPEPRRFLARRVAVGVGFFLLGCGILFFTNLARFGDGFEFGHRLNLQFHYGSMYATRFDHPFADEPLLSALRETFGLLFLTPDFTGGDFYREGVFPGQSATVRWRELYLSTYDLTFLGLLLGGWGTALWQGWRWTRRSPMQKAIAAVGVYSLLSAILLLAFFLRNSVISSRYLLDFMPAFAAALLAGWLGWCAAVRSRRNASTVLLLSFVALASWTTWEVASSTSEPVSPRTATRAETRKPSAPPLNHAAHHLSGHYASPGDPTQTWIPYNGAGWQPPSGQVRPCVILFVEDPQFLELELAGPDTEDEVTAPRDLRAKVGLEFLKLESIQRHGKGWRVRFAGPTHDRYQHGLQTVFLATVPQSQLASRGPTWRLITAKWHQDPNRAGD